MKTLMANSDIKVWVLSLNGYLSAMRDMNDVHHATRYWFSADMIDLEEQSVKSAIKEYCLEEKVHIKEITLGEELEIIESYILDNYLFGSTDPANADQNYTKKLHGWRIQEYISLATQHTHEYEEGRWAVETDDGKIKKSKIFVKIKNHLVVMKFWKKRL